MQSTYNAPSAFNGSSARSRGASAARRVARKLRKNMPVRKALAKPGKTIAKGNRSAIYTLGKQVKNLQLSQFGDLKRQIQSCTLKDSTLLHRPLSTTPLIMNLTNFYDGAAFFQGSVSPIGLPVLSFSQVMKKQTYDLDLNDSYQFNERRNDITTVNERRYLPISSLLKFTLNGAMPAGSTRALRYRFTILTTKRQPVTSSVINVALPYATGALWHMSEDDPKLRNYFSKKYHRIISDKWITIMPAKNNTNHIPVYRTVEMPYIFGRKTPLETQLTQPNPSGQTVYTNLPEDEIVWCLISSNATGSTGIDIDFTRTNIWRDHTVD